MPPTPLDSPPPSPLSPVAPQGLRRRRAKGYAIYSDEEPCSSGGEEEECKQPLSFTHLAENEDKGPDLEPTQHESIPKRSAIAYAFESVHTWIAASVLPQYTQEITVPPAPMNFAERMVSAFTFYGELKEAGTESDYEPAFERLQREWQYAGGLVSLSLFSYPYRLSWGVARGSCRCECSCVCYFTRFPLPNSTLRAKRHRRE